MDQSEGIIETIPVIDEEIGFLNRIWQGRIWYGTEWYITVLGFSLLVFIILMTIFAPFISPFDPNELIAGPFIPPGGGRQTLLARSGETPIFNLDDMSGIIIGTQRNKGGGKVAETLGTEGQSFMLEKDLISGLQNGVVDLILVDMSESENILSKYDGLEIAADGIGRKYLLGTDNLGRDVVSRIIWGSRTVIGVALTASILSFSLGVSIGLISGFIGGRLDKVLSLVMDSIYSFPGLILAIALVSMLGPGVLNVAVAVSVVYVPTFFRVVRGLVLSIKEEVYVEAARSLGAKSLDILRRYIFPNVIPSIVVVFSLSVADAILTEAGLSFIGLGLPPDIPDWGYDVSKGASYLVAGHWWLVTFPGIMITLVATGFTLFGEGLSEILNPRLVKN
ncbi:MAG: ABC transporter permease [Anaerolineales bacterium]|jgi:peptide/nickel transport system permease protein